MKAKDLIDALGGIDPELLKDAEGAPIEKAKSSRFPTWARLASLAAALSLTVGVVLAVFLTPKNTERELPSWLLAHTADAEANDAVIDGLDEMNYYAAKSALSGGVSAIRAALCGSRLPRIGTLSRGINVYTLDPEETFTVTKVIAFQIELGNPENVQNGFLASHVGEGVIDVIITENSLESMITFRNGNRYFSCLLNGYERLSGITVDGGRLDGSVVRFHFSTHKYIEGFRIVKNLEADNYGFYISLNEKTGEVVNFRCAYSGDGSSVYEYAPDTASVVPASSYVSDVSASFTVKQLEAYCRSFGKEE